MKNSNKPISEDEANFHKCPVVELFMDKCHTWPLYYCVSSNAMDFHTQPLYYCVSSNAMDFQCILYIALQKYNYIGLIG